MITRAQVFGMRCSGTNYLESLLRQNIPSLHVLETGFDAPASFGWKHSDVGTGVRGYFNGKPREVKVLPLDWPKSADTILLVLYRNPFNWLQSLRLTPHQAHEFVGLDFNEFIRKPWRAFYSEPGSENAASEKERLKWVKEKNLWEAYASVLAMRQAKINIFESFKYRFQHAVYLNYESLVKNPEGCVNEIVKLYGLKSAAKFKGVDTYKGEGAVAPFKQKQYDPISHETLRYLLKHIAWPEEKQVGYDLKPGAPLLARSKRAHIEPVSLLRLVPRHRYYRRGELMA